MADLKLRHLTREQHLALAEALTRAQQALADAARIVERVAFSDRTIYARKLIQERLIDPLRDQWETMENGNDSLYPSVFYAGGKR